MTKKQKFIYVFVSVLTFGIYPILVNKQKYIEANNKLSEAKSLSVNSTVLIKNLGGKDNITFVEHTHIKLKIFINNSSMADIDSINHQKGVTGVFVSSKSITIIVGNQAKQLSKIIEK